MAKYCGEGCRALCDFCKHYKDKNIDDEFTGYGDCIIKNIEVDAGFSCENDFECFKS